MVYRVVSVYIYSIPTLALLITYNCDEKNQQV